MNNNTFYKNSILKYGISAKGVHWDCKNTQYKRFEIITSFIQNTSCPLVDAGCGFGEYYKYLQEHNHQKVQYIGYDCYDKFIYISKQRFLNITFEDKNILNDNLINSDYYICSGALNTLNKTDVKIFINKCFSKSKKAFIFNYLKEKSVSDLSKVDLLKYCKTLSNKIEIKDDYLDNDFTICIFK